jgi:hypothetical protein
VKFEFAKFELSKTPLNQLCVDFVKSQLGRLTLEVAMHSGAAEAVADPLNAMLTASASAAEMELILFFMIPLSELLDRLPTKTHETCAPEMKSKKDPVLGSFCF